MIAGNRREPLEEKRQRHIKETKDRISGWNTELECAIEWKDQEYKRYCEFMIGIEKNTLQLLENYEIF